MGRWIARRLLTAIPVLIVITAVIFFVIRLAPGDPALLSIDPTKSGGRGGDEYIRQRRAELHLDAPLPVQYVAWLGDVVHGNLGYSFTSKRPVLSLLAERAEPSLRLMGAALIIAVLLGIPVGILAALRQYSKLDYVAAGFSLSAISIPSFFLCLGAIYIFSLRLDLLPAAGMFTAGKPRELGDEIAHLIMPASILSLLLAGPLVRYTRASVLDTLDEQYLVTARAKGLSAWTVVVRHALPNALIPLITFLGLQLPFLAGGAIVIEQIFSWPGMGQLLLAASQARDYPVLMGYSLVLSVLVLVSYLVTDIAYAIADPRIRL